MRRLFSSLSLVFAGLLVFAGCSPTYDWREVRGPDAPYLAMLPGKPATHTRPVNLNGIEVPMTMMAAEVEEVVFAVGSASLPDPAQASFALEAMKTALVKNINGKVRSEKELPLTAQSSVPVRYVEAAGTPGATRERQPHLLLARLMAKDGRVYQLLVLGPEAKVDREQADTFLSSFKLQ
jgi:hypothetical protein